MYCAEEIKSAEQIELGVFHHFSDNEYAKECIIKKGTLLVSHKHSYSHLSIVAKGKCVVTTKDPITGVEESKVYTAPSCLTIKAGVEHQVESLEDTVWYCIHATNEKNHENIDKAVIANASIQ